MNVKYNPKLECPDCGKIMKRVDWDKLMCNNSKCGLYNILYKIPIIHLEPYSTDKERDVVRAVEAMLRIQEAIWDGLSLTQISRLSEKLKMAGCFPPYTNEMIKKIEIKYNDKT